VQRLGEAALIIEDSPHAAAFFGHMLRPRFGEVIVVGSIGAALAVSERLQTEFELLVAAVQVRGRYSDAGVARLAELQPQMRTLLISTLSLDVLVETGFINAQRVQDGSVTFVQKPCTAAEFLRAVLKAMEREGRAHA
jgi:response regulator RpfG family c-di-GMP phosphodiesterase